jgi:hypothetical protein
MLEGRNERLIAEKSVSANHLIRVIFIRHNDDREIITFYPFRKGRYAS